MLQQCEFDLDMQPTFWTSCISQEGCHLVNQPCFVTDSPPARISYQYTQSCELLF